MDAHTNEQPCQIEQVRAQAEGCGGKLMVDNAEKSATLHRKKGNIKAVHKLQINLVSNETQEDNN